MDRPVSGKRLLVVVGATAVGKTDISFRLAQHFKCPILSADSRQCYQELGVATSKPSPEMREKVQHFFIDSHSIFQPISVADFEKFALNTLEQIYLQHDWCIMTGGSGLYVRAVVEGLDAIPEVPESIRANLEKRLENGGLEPLLTELSKLDADILKIIDPDNPRRVIRALAVCLATGIPYSTFRTGKKQERPFETIQIGLLRDRSTIYHRINKRMDAMIDQGIFEEAQDLLELKDQAPLQTVGFQEVFGYLEGRYNRSEAIRLLKRNSRRYAKRQLTWFRKDPSIHWFPADDLSSILDFLKGGPGFKS
jgi:tRNA dimethylallyltransferase